MKTFFFHPRIHEISHMLRNENLSCLVFTLDKVFAPLHNCLCHPVMLQYSGAGPGDTNDSILYDHDKYVILLVKVKIVLNSSKNLEM